MRRPVIALVTLAVAAGLANGASAAPKPVKMTHYFHGSLPVGEVETAPSQPSMLPMDATKPTGTQAKSKGVTNYVGGPNTACAGNGLVPGWTGKVSGTITTATVVLYVQGTGGEVEVQLYADVDGILCNENQPKIAGSAKVTLPATPGAEIKIPIKIKKLAPKSSINVQVNPTLTAAGVLIQPFVARVQYDATSALSRIEFTCIPKTGKKAC